MYSRLVSWSRRAYLAGIVLALVLVIPTAWFPFQLSKVAAFSAFLFIAAILFVLGGGMREAIRSYGFFGVLLVALLPLSYLLSAAFSLDGSVGWSGFGIETDTVVFTTLLFLACMLSFMLFRTLRTVRMLSLVVFWALIAAAIFQCISIIFGSAAIPFSTFADRSVNLVGKWNDLGLLVGLLGLMFIARVELIGGSPLWRAIVGVILAAITVLLGIINFSLVWGLVLFFCIVLGVIKFFMQRMDMPEGAPSAHWLARLPWYAIAGMVISILFLFFGSSLNLQLTNLFPVSSLEVRPSYQSTFGVINAARGGSFERVLVGTGPNTYGEEWLAHKPAEVNQSAFWNLDFNVGFSTLVTALGTVGIIGAFAWLIPMLLVLIALLRALRAGVLNKEDKVVSTTLSIAALFLLATTVFYVPSQNIILVAFVLAGATFGFLWRQGRSSVENDAPLTGMGAIMSFVAIALLVVLSAWTALITDRRLIAEAYAGSGSASLQAGNTDVAIASAMRSAQIEPTIDAYDLAVQANITKLQGIANASDAATAEKQQTFASTVQAAIAAGQAAQKLHPADYRPTLLLAQLYDFLSQLGVQGASATAEQTYQNALAQNPNNPSIPLALARLSAVAGNQQKTTNYLTQALTLKPNYTDAILLVVQLDVANRDIPSAIRAATAAAQTAPGVAPIWFELGLLYYSAGDAKSASQAFEQAVAIQSDYANAKYFLGLSYYILGRTPDAIKQFQDLAVSNPDNAEVKLILSNLTSGKKPFDGAQPPVTPNPQSRETAPIQQ